MGRKFFLLSFAAVFSLLFSIQGYFALDDDAAKNLRAERIGASLVSMAEDVVETGEELISLSVYLTMETKDNAPAGAKLLINGKYAGDFSRGVLTVRVVNGDLLSVTKAKDVTINIVDYPEGLDQSALPPQFIGGSDTDKWGKIYFK